MAPARRAAPAADRSNVRSTAASTAARSLVVALAVLLARVLDRAAGRRCRRRCCRRTSTGRRRASLATVPRTPLPRPLAGRRRARSAAAAWFRDQMRQYDLPVSSDTWTATIPGRGRTRLQNLWAVARGSSRQAIVVMAHRDDAGRRHRRERQRDRDGRARRARARLRAVDRRPASRVRSGHTIVFLSTDGGSFGGLGALALRVASAVPRRRGDRPRRDRRARRAADRDRRRRASLAGGEPRRRRRLARIEEQAGRPPGRPSVVAPADRPRLPVHAVRPGPVRRARHPRAHDSRPSGARPPESFTDRSSTLSTARIGQIGRAAQQLVGSLDQGLELAQGTTTFVWAGDSGSSAAGRSRWSSSRCSIPYLVAVVDLFAHCRRRRIPLLPAMRSLRSRLRGLAVRRARRSTLLGALGAWPTGEAAPAEPGVARSRRLAGPRADPARCDLVRRLAPRAAAPRAAAAVSAPEEQLAGETAALIGLGIVALLVLATNPYALLFFVPALHAWLWLPQRARRGGGRSARSCSSPVSPARADRALARAQVRARLRCAVVPARARVARVRPRARRRDHARGRRMRRATRRRDGAPLRAVPRARRAAAARAVPRARPRARAHGARAPDVVRRVGRILGAAADRRGRSHAHVGRRRLAVAGPVHRALHAHPAEPPVTQLRAARPRVPPATDASGRTSPRSSVQVAAEARAYRRTLHTGDPVGRLQIGRIGLKMVVVQGTDHETLKKGPGHYEPSAPPGRGPPDLHRRTPHDVPRAVRAHQRHQGRRLHHASPSRTRTFTYRVQRHYIVRSDQLSVLQDHGSEILRLQACHPRFFATHRYIVDAKLASITPTGGADLPRQSGSQLTVLPAASSPSPRGTSTSALACGSARDHVRLLTAQRRDETAGVDPRAHELVASGVALQRDRETAGQERGTQDRRAPCSAASAGRTNSSKPTSDETGLPGKPNTSVDAARRERDRLPGLHRDAPEHFDDAELREQPADEVVLADRHAAGGEQHVGVETALERGTRRVCVVGDGAVHLRRRRPRSGAAPRASPCSTRRSRPARAARPGGAARCRSRARRRADDARTEPSRARRRRARRVAPGRTRLRQERRRRPPRCHRRADARSRRARRARPRPSRPRLASARPGRPHRRRPERPHRSRWRSPGRARASRPTDVRQPTGRRRRAHPACRRRGRRTRPSPSSETAAGRRARLPPRRGHAPQRPQRARPRPPGAGRARARARALRRSSGGRSRRSR